MRALPNGLTAIKVAAIAGLVVVAFLVGRGSSAHFVPFVERRRGRASASDRPYGLGLVAVFFSFGGFWEASRVAGEIRDPEKTLPRALGLGVAVVTLAYAATTRRFSTSSPSARRRAPPISPAQPAEAILGRSGPAVLSAVVLVSVVVSALAFFLMAPRLYVAMARDGSCPPSLASRTPRCARSRDGRPRGRREPARRSGSFSQIVAYFLCPALVFIALAAAALFVVRRRQTGGAVRGARLSRDAGRSSSSSSASSSS